MILSGLAKLKTFVALELAADYLDNDTCAQEAAAAVIKIAPGTRRAYPEKTRAILKKVLAVSRSDSVRAEAERLLKKIENTLREMNKRAK